MAVTDTEFRVAVEKITSSLHPEDLFGSASTLPDLKRGHRLLIKVIHPDNFYGDPVRKLEAQETLKQLEKLYEEAKRKLDRSTYGTTTTNIVSKKREYTVGSLLLKEDIANLYECHYIDGTDKRGIFKVSRDPTDNDLLQNEVKSIKQIRKNDTFKNWFPYIPEVIDSFRYRDSADKKIRQINVFPFTEGLYSFEEIHKAYPDGVHPKDIGWIWRRVLLAIGLAHNNGLVHGAVVPSSILVHPEHHGLILTNWSYSCSNGEKIKAVINSYKPMYPEERTGSPGMDIYIGAKSMLYLAGDSLPRPLRAFFNGCLLSNPKMRPSDVSQLIEEWAELLEKMWGPPAFHELKMP